MKIIKKVAKLFENIKNSIGGIWVERKACNLNGDRKNKFSYKY